MQNKLIKISQEGLSERTRYQVNLMSILNAKFPRMPISDRLKLCQTMYEDSHRSEISNDVKPVYHSKA